MQQLTLIDLVGPLSESDAAIALACQREIGGVRGLKRRALVELIAQSGLSLQDVEARVDELRRSRRERIKVKLPAAHIRPRQ